MTVIKFPADGGRSPRPLDNSALFVRSICDAGASIAAACECLNDPSVSNASAKAADELILAIERLRAAAEAFRDGLPPAELPAANG